MKTKDIIIAAVSGIIFILALYFVYIMLFPATSSSTASSKTTSTGKKTTISSTIDTETLDKLKAFKDYGGSTLDNIGRVNPFGPLN